MKIALYGGKFDPPHLGHWRVIQAVVDSKLVDEVWLIPAKTHSWREIYASEKERLEMLSYFTGDKVKICDVDLKRDKETITIDTARDLVSQYPGNEFFFILGSDNISRFYEWEENEELRRLVKFLVYPRLGSENIDLPEGFEWFLRKVDSSDVSSTEIRERVSRGESIKQLVPKEVEEYIQTKGLYES